MTTDFNALQVTNYGNDNFNSATPLGGLLPGVPLTLLGTINDSDTADFYHVRVDTPLISGIGLQNLTGDLNVEVFDSNGNLIANGNNLGTSDEAFQAPFFTPGEYFISVNQSATGVASNYQLGIFPAPAPVNTINTINDSINTPSILGPIVPQGAPIGVSGVINALDGVDYYSITVDQPLVSGIALQNLTDNIDVAVLDSNGNLIARGENLGASDEAFQAAFFTPGEYLLNVYRTAPDVASNYDLTLFPGVSLSPGNPPPTPTPQPFPPVSVSVSGDLGTNDEFVISTNRFFADNSDETVVRKRDYLLQATPNTPITLELSGNNGGDPFLEVFEIPQGADLLVPQTQQIPIAANDNGGDGLNALIGPGVESDSLGVSSQLTLSENVNYLVRVSYNERPFSASFTLDAGIDNGSISLDRVFEGNPIGAPVIAGEAPISGSSIEGNFF